MQINDIGVLFATLQAAYGYQWAHGADAIPVWQEKLRDFTPQQVMRAASQAIDRHPDYPPSLGQMLDILRSYQPRQTTLIEDQREPGRMSRAEYLQKEQT